MKKLMFIAAAALCSTVFAEDPIVSNNIVGYANSNTAEGFKLIGAQFANVGSDKAIDLTDIKATGYGESTEGDIEAQVLDANGRRVENYYFYHMPDEFTGWADNNNTPIESGMVTIKPGEGFWVKAPNASCGIQSAGEVQTEPYAVTLRNGFISVVNSTPLAVDLTKVEADGYGESTEGDIAVQTLDARGQRVGNYYFYDIPEFFGWADQDNNPVEAGAVVIQPGEGLWVYSPNDSYTLTMPGADVGSKE